MRDLCCSYFTSLLCTEAEPLKKEKKRKILRQPSFHFLAQQFFFFFWFFRSGGLRVAAVRWTRHGDAPAASHRAVKNISRAWERPASCFARRPVWRNLSGRPLSYKTAARRQPPNADRLPRAGSQFVVISSDAARQVHLGEPRRRLRLEFVPRSEKCHVKRSSAEGAETVSLWFGSQIFLFLTNNLTQWSSG